MIKLESGVPTALLLIVLSFLGALLHHSVREINQTNAALHSTIEQQQQIIDMQKSTIASQDAKIEEVVQYADTIELALGLSQQTDRPLNTRLKQALSSSSDRALLLQLIPNGSPVVYNGITSRYGYRKHPVTKRRSLHRGTDLRASIGTAVYATADGVVEFSGRGKGFGRLIKLSHSYGFETKYGHLNKSLVKKAQVVKKGDLIGYSGNSGISTGAHLHYEVSFIQRSLNPYWFIKWEQDNYNEIFAKIKGVTWDEILEDVASRQDSRYIVLSEATN